MENFMSFNEWLKTKDEHLYAEITAQDVWSGIKTGARTAKSAWDTTGKAIGKKARNVAAGTALGVGALAAGLSGNPDVELVARHNNMTPVQVKQIQQSDPQHYNFLLQIAKTSRDAHSLKQNIDKQLGLNQPEPKDGYNWTAPTTHYQSPWFQQKQPQPKTPTAQDTIRDIDRILGK